MPREIDAVVAIARGAAERVQTTFPGYVVAYDRASQTANVQVIPRVRYRDPVSDTVRFERVPVLPNCPVLWPSWGGGACSLVGDLQAGDPVWVVLADRSIDEWKDTGNTDTEPQVPRRWDWSDAVVLPGGRPNASPLASAAYASGAVVLRGTDIRLGSSAATDYVALASLVLAQLDALKTALNSWTPVPGDGGAALKVILTALVGGGWPSSVAAAKVKAE